MTSATRTKFSIRLLRHATLVVNIRNTSFLVDPMLSPKDAMDPVGNAESKSRIPMVDLPVSNDELSKILGDVDAILVTHTHRDHWDDVAQKMINKAKPVFCQPADLEKIKGQGFTDVHAIEDTASFKGITIHRTGGQHGTGEIGQRMGTVSGFVLEAAGESLYIAGDTIWCAEVEEALNKFKPQTTVVNAGGAQFLTGDPITMSAADVLKVSTFKTRVVAVHMDTVNHCKVTREVLRNYLQEKDKTGLVFIPADGSKV
ncbi:MAG TPA: MBL fold metallo-hydrolase [Cyclobacteriaceae bacterium]|nr:MBL fold metallo-hydrolase [Cyclobacteriaceae bacterium]